MKTQTLRYLIPALVFLALLLFIGRTANATPALDFTGGGAFDHVTPVTYGWRFTVASPIIVDALGLFDFGADGLLDDPQIGLWNNTGTVLLASTTITTANSTAVGSLSSLGDWRFTAISPLLLSPGDYVVGATFPIQPSERVIANATASTVPGVTFDAARFVVGGSGLTFPSNETNSLNAGIFGPNFDVVATPEPITMFLGGTGLLSLAYAGRRRLFGR